MSISRHIIADHRICHGTPVFKGTRIMVWQILELLEAGETYQNIYKAHPSLPKGAVKAALHYAAQKAKGSSFIVLNRRLHEKAKVFDR